MGLTEKQKHCSYCQDGKPLISTLYYEHKYGPQKGQIVHIENRALVVEEETVTVKEINYCPMCGQPLGDSNGKD